MKSYAKCVISEFHFYSKAGRLGSFMLNVGLRGSRKLDTRSKTVKHLRSVTRDVPTVASFG